MDFVIRLQWSQGRHDAIWVIIDKLIKFAYFIPIHTTGPKSDSLGYADSTIGLESDSPEEEHSEPIKLYQAQSQSRKIVAI